MNPVTAWLIWWGVVARSLTCPQGQVRRQKEDHEEKD